MKNKNLIFDHAHASNQELNIADNTPSLKSVYSGFNSAKKYSTPELELKIESHLERPLDKGLHPYTSGLLFEYLSRNPNIPESIKTKIKTSNINWKEYFDEFSKDRRTASTATLVSQSAYWGSLIGLFGVGIGLAKSKSLNDLPSAQNVRSFTENVKNRYGLDTRINILKSNDSVLGSFYDPSKNMISTGRHYGIAAHELGHAKNFQNYKKIFGERGGITFGNAFYGGVRIPPHVSVPYPSIALLPLLSRRISNRLQGDDPNSLRYKIIQKIEDNPGTAMAISTTPRLLEEAVASGRALSNVIRYKPEALTSAIKALGPAFGTYLLSATPLVAFAYAKGLQNRKQDELRLNNKVHILKQSSLAQQISQQQESVTQLKRQIEGTQGPLPNFLRTPILGDQKQSRTAGLNSTPQANKLQQRHSPIIHREIGKKYAGATIDPAVLRKYFAIPSLASSSYSAYRGIQDDENNIPAYRGALSTAGVGATLGGLGGLAYTLFHKPTPAPKSLAIIIPALATGLIGAGVYGAARSGDELLEKLIYEQNSDQGNSPSK